MNLKTIPKNYRIRITLCDEKGSPIGEAMVGMDFMDARKEYYGESGLDINLHLLWQQYLDGLLPQEKELLLNRNGEDRADNTEQDGV